MRLYILRIITCGLAFCGVSGCIPHVECPPAPYQPTPCLEIPCDTLFEPGEWVSDGWWEIFGDCQLNDLVALALSNNPEYHAAFARIDVAQYNADIVRSQLFPQITFDVNVLREKLSKTGIIPAGPAGSPTPIAGAPNIPFYFTQYELNLNFSYDFDVWGRRRSTLKAALGDVQSKIADESFAKLELTVAVAQAYLLLQVSYKRLEVYEKLVANREKYLAYVQARLSGNLDNATAINDAQGLLSTAKQMLDQIRLDIALYKHQLQAYIGGDFCREFSVHPVSSLPSIPIPCDIPLNLISHRPDIISQLWVIESLGDLMDAARAGYYPDFNISALAGLQTIHFKQLFEASSFYGFVGPAFNVPLFDGGFLDGNLRLSGANYRLAILDYNSMVIQAVQEVADAIARVHWLHRQHNEFESRNHLLLSNYRLVEQRIANNINSGLDGLNAESSMLETKDKALVSLGNTFQGILSLIKALGGGYESPVNCEVVE